MITSMTGYGKTTSSFDGFSFEVEAKSVNNRYLEISLKLPASIQNKEFELKEFIKNKVKRGKIYISLGIKSLNGNELLLNLNGDKLNETVSLLKKIKGKIKSRETIKLEHILSFRDLFTPELVEISENHFNTLKATIGEAIDAMNIMRKNEGQQLCNDLLNRINLIEENLKKIEDLNRTEIEIYFGKLKERARSLVENITDYSDRLEIELALIAERADVTEECVRLRSHLKHFRDALNEDNEIGRKLNFLCQEMHREGNTIASKSLSSDVTYKTIIIREEIEKIREQIQNIE